MLSDPTFDQGQIAILLPTDPAVATDWTHDVPDTRRVELVCVRFQIVTDANAANRYPGLTITDGLAYTLKLTPTTAITAGLTVIVNFWAGLGYDSGYAANRYTAGLPTGLILDPGTTIASEIRQIQAADQLSDIQIYTRSWTPGNVA